jgi:hypothetical protein
VTPEVKSAIKNAQTANLAKGNVEDSNSDFVNSSGNSINMTTQKTMNEERSIIPKNLN